MTKLRIKVTKLVPIIATKGIATIVTNLFLFTSVFITVVKHCASSSVCDAWLLFTLLSNSNLCRVFMAVMCDLWQIRQAGFPRHDRFLLPMTFQSIV